ncbi:paraquat-inducible protein A [Psychromonas sp. MME2]|uniref:paraquat-inducible protein A n=1 Tax=unclassified Psychromonas TaxID=2614957 RepID=UPI00339BA651
MKTILCGHCDMVSQLPDIPAGHVAKCFRCKHTIFKQSRYPISTLLALSLTALIISLPAFYLPLFSIHLLGKTEPTNIIQGALMMANSAPIVSYVVLFCAVVAPTVLMVCITISCACLTFDYRPLFLRRILKTTHLLLHWSMLEVYALSLMVAIFKLINYAQLFINVGFYFFIGLLLVNLTVIHHYNHHDLWERYINE